MVLHCEENMANLITADRARANINQSSFSSGEDDTIDTLVAAVSQAVRNYCRREFDAQSFDELYCGSGNRLLLLKQYPIVSVSRVAVSPAVVLTIRNSSSSNQRATVSVTSTGISLVRVASGVSSMSSVTFAGNVTLSAVKDAVNALGNGWSASVTDSRYELWASSDLRAVQGALNAKDFDAPLRIHLEELSNYSVDTALGMLIWEPDCADGVGWSEGRDNYRVIYSAGYATVPEDVQEACAQWVAALFWQTKDNPAVYPDLPGAGIALLLDPYRRYGV